MKLSENNFCTTKAGLAAGSTTTYTTANAVIYSLDGEALSFAAQSSQTTPTLDTNTGVAFVGVPINKGCIFIFGILATVIAVVQGPLADLDSAGNFILAPGYPAIPDGFVPFGELIIKVASTGSTWTFGASNQASVTGVTYIRKDLLVLKSRPHSS